MTTLEVLVSKTAAHPRIMFLVNGIGAVSTAFLTGVVLPKFDTIFTMPRNILTSLAVIACLFAVYSLTCSVLNVKAWQRYLRIIAILNTLYCTMTLGLVVYLFAHLTVLDMTYFFGEIGVIGIVVVVELSTIAYSRKHRM